MSVCLAFERCKIFPEFFLRILLLYPASKDSNINYYYPTKGLSTKKLSFLSEEIKSSKDKISMIDIFCPERN